LAETGSGNPSSPDRSYDLSHLKSDIQSAMPRTGYANFWSGWGPNLQANAKAAMSDPFWINKSQCQSAGGVADTPIVSTPHRCDTPGRSDIDHLRQRPDKLLLRVSEDAYGPEDAKFTVSIGGKQIGGTFTAAADQEQSVTLNGDFGRGTHDVSVRFLNDAWGGTPSSDRNLYVDSITYDGMYSNRSAYFAGSGVQGFTISDGTPATLPPLSPTAPPTATPITFSNGPDNPLLQAGVAFRTCLPSSPVATRIVARAR
jgi:hypothetical protein